MAIPINIEKLISGRIVESERIEYKRGIIHNRRYRNRRIGDFLKELNITEGRGAPKTGGYYFTEKVDSILNN